MSEVDSVCSTDALSSELDFSDDFVDELGTVLFTGADVVETISCGKGSFDNGSSAADKNTINKKKGGLIKYCYRNRLLDK